MSRARRRPTRRGDERAVAGRGPGAFVVAFLGVLAVGGLALGLGLLLAGRREPSMPGAGAAAGGAAEPGGARVSAELGAHFTSAGDPVLGRPEAPVTVVEYSDYQCPSCRQFATEVVPYLKESWLPRGLVKVVYKDFAIRGPASERAAQAAHCAGDQGRYWGYHDALFARSGEEGLLEPAGLIALASELGLDAARLGACLEEGGHADRVAASTAEGHARGFEGTPTYLIDGRETSGAIAVADWEALFQAYAQELGVPAP